MTEADDDHAADVEERLIETAEFRSPALYVNFDVNEWLADDQSEDRVRQMFDLLGKLKDLLS